AVLMDSPFFIRGVMNWMAGQQTGNAHYILSRFRSLKKNYNYHDILLADTEGKVLLSISGNSGGLHPRALKAFKAAIGSRKPVLSEIHNGPSHLPPHVDVIAPLFISDRNTPVGGIVLQSDAREFFYPLVQSWPTPSRTAETLLVRRVDDEVLFLNDLRHRPSAALNLRIPLSRSDLPAAMAVLGREGFVRGMDYRGVEVFAVLKNVPGFSWFMVAKVDVSEALAFWKLQSNLILALLVVLTALAGAAGLFLWQRSMKNYYRRLYQSESELRESRERYRVTLMSVGDGVIASDAEGRVELVNPVAERLTGYSQKEALGKQLDQVFHTINEHSRAGVENPVARVLREGIVVGLGNHTLLIARDGTERPVVDSGAPIRNEQGDITGVVLVFRDQSAERAAQKKLQEQMERSQQYLDTAGVMIVALDRNGKVELINKKGCEILGFSEKEITGKNWFEHFIPEHSRERIRKLFQQRITDQTDMEEYGEDSVLTKNGEERLIAWHNTAVRDQSGAVVSILCSGNDITEHRAAEKALQESEKKYRSLYNSIRDAILVADTDRNIIDCNAAFAELFGYTLEEIRGKKTRYVYENDEEFKAMGKEISDHRGDPGFLYTVHYRKKSGEVFPGETNVFYLRDDRGEIKGFIGLMRDITERKQAEADREKLQAQLLQAQKMESVGRLAGGIAHDFNNMLSVILGHTELELMRADPSDPLYTRLKEIQRASQRSAELTRQLLGFARKQTVEPRVLDLNETVEGMLTMMHRLIGENIDLVWMPDDDLWEVEMDPAQIDQILANLCINARDAIQDVGKVTIEIKNVVLDQDYCSKHAGFIPGQYVMLAVSDNGCGMDRETLAHLFEPFFTTKDFGEGTGLGLATVYGIVKQNNGFINVYSEPGQGTTFRIYLPRYAGKTKQTTKEAQPEKAAGGAETILLVEDEPTILELGRVMLEELGYSVYTAGTPGQAIQLAQEHINEIHLLVTDTVMPEMNGRDLARRIQSINPKIKCMFMSGYTANVVAHQGVLDEGAHFLQKPFTMHTLARKVREVLEG
ncbi:MAG: PAS domain S-box protein, partial [Spirochaetota bacterium]